MSSVHPTTVGLTTSSHLHDPENLGYRALHRLVIFRIIELLHRHDDLDIVEDIESQTNSSSVDGADGASNHSIQNTPPHTSNSPLTYEEKVERLVDAIMDGRRLHFSPSADNSGYTVYAMRSPRSQQAADGETDIQETDEAEPDDELEQQISEHPENFGQVIATFGRTMTPDQTGNASGSAHPQNFGHVVINLRRTTTPYPTGSASGLAHSHNIVHVTARTRRPPTPYPTGSAARSSSPDENHENVTPNPAGSASGRSSPDENERFQSILDWSAQVRNAASETSIVDGRIVAVMGQAGVEYHHVSPIPFDIHKKVRTTPGTPSISSHGTILDCSSPSFVKTCKGIVKQSYLDITPSLVAATTVPRLFNNDKGHGGRPSLPDAGSDPGNPGEPGNPEDIDIWEDIESGNEHAENDQQVIPNVDALRVTTDLRRPGYLQYNSFYQDAQARAENATTQQRESPRITPPDSAGSSTTSFFTTHENFEHDADFAAAFAALEGVVISDSPDPQDSLSLFPRPLDLSRTVHIENTLAALEGRIAPAADSPSPIRRYVRPGGPYNNDVLVENLGPRLRHPMPSRCFGARAMLAKMEEKLVSGIENHGGFPEGRLFKRPSNPTLIRARCQYHEGSEVRGVVPGRRLVRRPADPTPLRARYLLGEASSA